MRFSKIMKYTSLFEVSRKHNQRNPLDDIFRGTKGEPQTGKSLKIWDEKRPRMRVVTLP